jgi:general secretion pathway protein D
VMRDNIAIFDVDWLAGMSFALFPVRSARAKAIAAELRQILGGEASPIGTAVRLVPIDRMNAIVAVSPRAGYLEEVERWIERLDQGTSAADQRIYVYYVQNGRAVDIAAVLAKVILGDRDPRRASDEGADQTRLPEPDDALGRTVPVVPVPKPPPALSDRVEPPAERRQNALEPGGPDSGIRLGPMSAIQITADEKNNALVIMATPREYAVIEAALKRLDVIPLQVLIEAAVAEVTLTNDLRYGLQYFIKQGSSQLVLSNFRTGEVAPQFPGFSYIFSSGPDIRVVLNMLESITDVSVISSPNLMVLNNQTATLQVGDQVPIATQSAVSVVTPGAPIVNTIQFRDTGVILKVTPRVNESGLVLIDVAQEVSEVAATTTSGIDSPTIQQRKVSSTVVIQDGETMALGGLIRDSRTMGSSGIPGLQSIPIIGALFGNKTDVQRRTELLVLITPRVVRNPVEAREITDELRRRMDATAPLFRSTR